MTGRERFLIRVEVRLRAAVYDPQGEAIRRALAGAGTEGVISVRQGKSFELELAAAAPAEAEKQAREVARRVLASPVLEDFEVAQLPVGEGGSASAES